MSNIFRFCGIALLAVLFCVSTPGQPAGQQPIIDMHLHAFSFDEMGVPAPPNEVTGKSPAAKNDEEAMRATLAELRKFNIVKAVASGPPELVRRWREAAPDIVLGGAFTGPGAELPAPAFLRSEVAAGRISVLGELGLLYNGLSPNDPSMEKYYALAEELDIPVGIHTGLGPPAAPYTCCPKFRVSLGNPALLEEVLVRHPKLRLYIMHAGWPYKSEMLALMHMYPQLYTDIAVINWAIPREEFHDYLKSLVRAGFGKRIMFGSDQMIWPDAIGLAIEGVESAEFLTPEQKRDIFYNNAATFLRLDKK